VKKCFRIDYVSLPRNYAILQVDIYFVMKGVQIYFVISERSKHSHSFVMCTLSICVFLRDGCET
jgi:hypothetical protein